MAITKVNHPDLLDLASDTGAIVFPKGTTAERPVSPEAGYIRFNTTDNVMETYDGTEWKVLDTIAPLPLIYSVDYLVVAGGGAGSGGTRGAAGGAGGLRTSYGTTSGGGASAESPLVLDVGTEYTVIVGAGGNTTGTWNNANTANRGTNGVNSLFSTIESIGGGSGGNNDSAPNNTGADGGSGGGSWYIGPNGGAGTVGQGFAGGIAATSPNYIGGGGGGASEVGENGGTTSGGGGGDGLQVSITGTPIYYAGGGSADKWGGISGSPIPGTPGLGGGGTGNNNDPMNQAGTAGSPNTGGGGGSGGSGGSGVVILRMPTANYSGTTTGLPTVTTDGSDTILTYTSSGTYTA